MADAEAFAAALEQQLERSLQVKFVPGLTTGANETTETVGSVYVDQENEVAQRVLEAELHAIIRICLPFDHSSEQDTMTPFNPAPLYALGKQLKAMIRGHQTDLGPWFQRVTAMRYDTKEQALVAHVLAYDQNDGQ